MVGCLAIMWDPSLLFVTVHVVLDEKPQKKTWKCGNLQFPKKSKMWPWNTRETSVNDRETAWKHIVYRERTFEKKHHFSIVFTIFMNFGFRWSKKNVLCVNCLNTSMCWWPEAAGLELGSQVVNMTGKTHEKVAEVLKKAKEMRLQQNGRTEQW